MIDVEKFKELYLQIQTKLEEVSLLDQARWKTPTNKDRDYLDVDWKPKEWSIEVTHTTYGWGKKTYQYDLWHKELNEPISYFEEKFRKEIEVHEAKLKKEEEDKKNAERIEYERLKAKYEGNE